MRELNKKVLGIVVVLMAVAMLAVPVMAKPTKGNKVEVSLIFGDSSRTIIPGKNTGKAMHFTQHQNWNVSIVFTNGTFINGTAFAERKCIRVPQKGDDILVLRDSYEFWFEDEGGGFEGKSLVNIKGFTGAPPPLWEKSKSNALFHGTEAYEGQTLNFGSNWRPFVGGIPTWTGYWLKP